MGGSGVRNGQGCLAVRLQRCQGTANTGPHADHLCATVLQSQTSSNSAVQPALPSPQHYSQVWEPRGLEACAMPLSPMPGSKASRLHCRNLRQQTTQAVPSDVHVKVQPTHGQPVLKVVLLLLCEEVVAAAGAGCCCCCIQLRVSAQQCEQPGLNDLGRICGCVWQVLVVNLHAERQQNRQGQSG